MSADTATALHILIVEDNSDCADSLAMLLRLYGHEVEVTKDGPTAVAEAHSHPPDVLLLDIALPGMSGYEVAKRVKEHPWKKKPLIIAMSGYGQEEDRRHSAAVGIDLHLTKPVDPEQLRVLLHRFREILFGGGLR